METVNIFSAENREGRVNVARAVGSTGAAIPKPRAAERG